jgi:hypothetical protein
MDPSTDLGKKGWKKTPYQTAYIPNYEELLATNTTTVI